MRQITRFQTYRRMYAAVMNLRGTVLPVVDLRMKFHLPEVEYNKFTVIVLPQLAKKPLDYWWMRSLTVNGRERRHARSARLRIGRRYAIYQRRLRVAGNTYCCIEPGRTAFRVRVGSAAIHRSLVMGCVKHSLFGIGRISLARVRIRKLALPMECVNSSSSAPWSRAHGNMAARRQAGHACLAPLAQTAPPRHEQLR